MKFLRKPFRYSFANSVFFLIAFNVIVFLLQLGFRNMTNLLALNTVAILQNGAWWQFLTYMFAHGSWSHLLVNMLALFFFGLPVERKLGTKEFLLFYFATGILAGVFSFAVYLVTGASYVQLLGASGALFAVQLAYAVFYPESRIYIWGLLPVRASTLVIGYTAVEVFATILSYNSGVAHLTHLAGFAFGWLYFLVRLGANPWYSLVGRR